MKDGVRQKRNRTIFTAPLEAFYVRNGIGQSPGRDDCHPVFMEKKLAV